MVPSIWRRRQASKTHSTHSTRVHRIQRQMSYEQEGAGGFEQLQPLPEQWGAGGGGGFEPQDDDGARGAAASASSGKPKVSNERLCLS